MSPLGVNRSSRSAVAIVPPESVWEPINAIRRQHDKQVVRWMPHVNLVFPFVHPDRLDDERERLAAAAASAVADTVAASLGPPPWQVTLGPFRHFKHASNRATVWLDLRPHEPLLALHTALAAQYPHLDTGHRFETGFTPHLTVGQTRTLVLGRRLADELNETWQPLTFTLDVLTVLRRTVSDPFEVAYGVPLKG